MHLSVLLLCCALSCVFTFCGEFGKTVLAEFVRPRHCADKTLDENGVEDEQEEFEALNLPDTFYIPSLFLYFNDDLTVA